MYFSRRTLLVGTAALLILVIGFLVFFVFIRQDSTSTVIDGASQNAPSLPLPDDTQPTITLRTASGDIVVKNFITQAQAISEYDVVIFESFEEGLITFIPEIQNFNINVGATSFEDFAENRRKLENRLLSALDISREDACKLNIYVGTGGTGADELDGVDFGFTGCPNFIPSPTTEAESASVEKE